MEAQEGRSRRPISVPHGEAPHLLTHLRRSTTPYLHYTSRYVTKDRVGRVASPSVSIFRPKD